MHQFLQDNYGLSITRSDGLMLLPEGGMIAVSLPLGLLIDRYRIGTTRKLGGLCASLCGMLLAYALLAMGFRCGEGAAVSPVISMVRL